MATFSFPFGGGGVAPGETGLNTGAFAFGLKTDAFAFNLAVACAVVGEDGVA